MCYDSNSVEVKWALGCKEGEHYYNAGVVLYDLKKYRLMLDKDKIVIAMETICKKSIMADQDLLNAYFKGQIKTLDMCYNYQPIHNLFNSDVFLNYFKNDYYTKEQIDIAQTGITILHSLRMFGDRPWDYNSLHPHAAIFDEYKSKSLWGTDVGKRKKKRIIHKVEYNLYVLLPDKVYFYLFFKIHKYCIIREIKKRKVKK